MYGRKIASYRLLNYSINYPDIVRRSVRDLDLIVLARADFTRLITFGTLELYKIMLRISVKVPKCIGTSKLCSLSRTEVNIVGNSLNVYRKTWFCLSVEILKFIKTSATLNLCCKNLKPFKTFDTISQCSLQIVYWTGLVLTRGGSWRRVNILMYSFVLTVSPSDYFVAVGSLTDSAAMEPCLPPWHDVGRGVGGTQLTACDLISLCTSCAATTSGRLRCRVDGCVRGVCMCVYVCLRLCL